MSSVFQYEKKCCLQNNAYAYVLLSLKWMENAKLYSFNAYETTVWLLFVYMELEWVELWFRLFLYLREKVVSLFKRLKTNEDHCQDCLIKRV